MISLVRDLNLIYQTFYILFQIHSSSNNEIKVLIICEEWKLRRYTNGILYVLLKIAFQAHFSKIIVLYSSLSLRNQVSLINKRRKNNDRLFFD